MASSLIFCASLSTSAAASLAAFSSFSFFFASSSAFICCSLLNFFGGADAAGESSFLPAETGLLDATALLGLELLLLLASFLSLPGFDAVDDAEPGFDAVDDAEPGFFFSSAVAFLASLLPPD